MTSYGLDWVDEDALFAQIKHALKNPLGLATSLKPTPPDPFSILVHSMIADVSFDEALVFEKQRLLNKKISNAVGNIHQGILALSPHWQTLGTTGGVLDLSTVPGYVHPRFNKPLVAEVKNRYNTIKASDEAKLWDKIDQAARLQGAQGYLFQITPQNARQYDREWTPSGRPAKATVRVCDGVTAYELVFGEPRALEQLYLAMPRILSDILCDLGRTNRQPLPDDDKLADLFAQVFPV